MKFQIDKNQIRMLEGPKFVTTGNVNSLSCSFAFDSGYKDLDTFAVFYRDDSLNRIVELDSSGSCVIPWELLQSAGYLYVGACGTKTTETEVLKRTTTNAAILRVENSLSSEVSPDAAPQPDIWEAYRTEILNIKTEVQNFKNEAQAIKDSTEIFYDVQTNRVGFRRADEENFTYTGDLTGPQGPQGLQGIQGIQGPKGEPGETMDAYFKAESDSRYANAITGEASGTLVTLSDAWAGGVLQKCEAQGMTTETGTGDKSPDNPYTIAGNEPVKITASGKNLFDITEMSYKTGSGSTYEVLENSTIRVTVSLAGTYRYVSFVTHAFDHLKGQEVTASADMVMSGSNNGQMVIQFLTNGASTVNQYIKPSTGFKTFTVPEAFDEVNLVFYSNADSAEGQVGDTVTYANIQIEAGNARTAFDAFASEEYALPTLEPLYSLLGGVCDTFEAAIGTETRRVGIITLDGTEAISNNITFGNITMFSYLHLLTDKKSVSSAESAGHCTHLPFEVPTALDHTCAYTELAALYLILPNSIATTIAQAQEWLAAQYQAGTPVTLVYQLAEPIITQHNPIAITIPAPTTNISADAGEVNITYTKDTSKVIASLEDRIKALEI